MKASVFMARYLKSQGLVRAFGLPGGEAVPLIEGLRQEDIPFLLTHHEAPAGFMAGTTGAITGVPGLCIATIGPGAVNMVSAVAMAHLDRLPLIAISGDAELCEGEQFTHQCLDLVGLFRPITKWSSQLRAADMERALPMAMELARSGRPGPVYFALSAAEASRDIPHLGDMSVDEIGRRYASRPDAVTEVDPSALLEAVARSRAPVLMIGLGVVSAAPIDLVGLAEQVRVPVVVTPQAKGYFPEDHPLFAGVFGLYTDAPIQELIGDADLVIAIGLDGVELFNPWKIPTPVVSIARAGAADPAYSPGIALDGDVPSLVDRLRRAIQPKDAWALSRVAECRRAVEAMMAPGSNEADGRVAPQVVVEELRRALPREGVLSVDVGAHKLVAAAQWPAYEPGSFLTTNGLSSMGYALPAAMAASLAQPGRPAAALTGDGGFLMYTGELETLARLGLPVTVVVLNDSSLSSIKVKQEKRNLPPVGVEFGELDYASIARSFGLLGLRSTTQEECATAFAEALASGRGAVVEVMVQYEEYMKYQ